MVGPMSPEERQSGMLRLKIGIALLVGISSGLVSLQGHPSLPVIAGVMVVGTLVGAALAWYVFPSGRDYR
ncbi:MAG: hypothetical protein ABEI57_00480 [Halapricum sp.]